MLYSDAVNKGPFFDLFTGPVASVVSNSGTLWTGSHQAPLSMRFSRQEHWSGLSCAPPGNLSDPVIQPMSPALKADFFTTEPRGKARSLFSDRFFMFLCFSW